MGKNQHQKDRMHITSIEWRRDFGGFKDKTNCRVLPLSFDCCAITLRPFEFPVCTADGNIFDISSITRYLKKYGKCPVTGKTLHKKDLFALKFHQNDKGKFHCPLTFHVFNENSHIVAIKSTGNVYSYEAVNKLNFKQNNWEDILNGVTFAKSDVIHLQNPHKLENRKISDFAHIKEHHDLKEQDEREMISSKSSINKTLIKINKIKKLNKEIKFNGKRLPKNLKSLKNASPSTSKFISNIYTTSQTAASFTSTAITPSCHTEMRPLTDAERRKEIYDSLSKRKECFAFVRIHTSHGDMDFSLDVKRAPMTCHNFLSLVARGYYDGTIFHRLIISFMIQGGDPEGTGFGGECAFGGKMKDEFHGALKHDSRGVLSMANSGANTNGSQFFITFGECSHLDRKHSVFGRLTGGMETLNRLERVKTDRSSDEPLERVLIRKITIFRNPFNNLEENEKKCLEKKIKVL